MPMSPNPRRDIRGLVEPVGKPRALALVAVQYRDPECLLHQPNVFRDLFPEGRLLDDLDYMDLDAVCTCKHEAHEPGARKRKERKPKVCPTCRTARAVSGTCFCD